MANFAFIDAQNVHQGIKLLGWDLDWKKFRVYLKERYFVDSAYIFIGFRPQNETLYQNLKECGYVLIFKLIIADKDGKVKGNCNADLVLHSLIKINCYKKAIIVTSDGDFYSLVRHLYEIDKLHRVVSSHVANCSGLLKREAKEKINYMSDLRKKIGK